MTSRLETAYQVFPKRLVVDKRERCTAWQCRYKVDNKWIRATTKKTQFDLAVNKAKELLVKAGIRKRSGIPVVTKRFKDIKCLTIDRIERGLQGSSLRQVALLVIVTKIRSPSRYLRRLTKPGSDFNALEYRN